MIDDIHAHRQAARLQLVIDAQRARRVGESAGEWEEDVRSTSLGQLLTHREIEAIWRLVWGIGCAKMR